MLTMEICIDLLELFGKPLLKDHIPKVKISQQKGKDCRHYLSPESQNESISLCVAQVTKLILEERELLNISPLWLMLHQMQIILNKRHSF